MNSVRFFVFLFFIISLLLTGFAYGAHLVSNSLTGTQDFGVVNEDISYLYNVTLNNSDVDASAHITQINLSLPDSFSYSDLTFNTSLSGYVLITSDRLISITNTSGLVMNSTTHTLWFNASAITPGMYNVTLTTVNASTVLVQNISVSINDTSAPAPITFVAPGYVSHRNLSANAIAVNATAQDNSALDTIVVSLYNSDFSTLVASGNSSFSASSVYVNFTGLGDGVYFVNLSANDSNGNYNLTVAPLRIALDSVAPSISFDEVSSNRTALNISVSISDATTGVQGTCSLVSGGGTISGSGSTQYIFRSGLSCDTDYTFNVTCSDYVGNSRTSADTFSTDGCASSSSSGSSGAGGSGGSTGSGGVPSPSSNYWRETFSASSDEFEQGYSILLHNRERVQVTVDGAEHHIGIIDIDSKEVTFNVSSTPQQATLEVNETRSFEVSDDDYYDLSVTLTWINESATSAHFTIRAVHELTPDGAVALGIDPDSLDEASGSRSFLTGLAIGNVRSLFSKEAWWIWIVVVFVGIALALALWKMYDKHRRLQGLKSEPSP